MKKLVQKIGKFSYNHPWLVVVTWVVILSVAITSALMFMRPTSDSLSIPGTAADVGMTHMKELFPEAGEGSARVVIKASDGKSLDDYSTQINNLVLELNKVDGVVGAISPFMNPNDMSTDRTTGIIQMALANTTGSVSSDTTSAVEKLTNELSSKADLQVEINGDIIRYNPDQILGVGEVLGVVVAFVVLLILFRIFSIAGLTLLNSIVGVAITAAGMFGLSQVIDINSTTPALAVMLGLAVGIDYSLFIFSKYQDLIESGKKPQVATQTALATSGTAVIYAALTVAVALLALSILNIPFITIMGLAGVAAVIIAALVATTLLPVYFRFMGTRVLPKTRKPINTKKHQAKPLYAYGKFITSKWPISVIIVIVITIATALPVMSMTLGLPNDQFAAKNTTQKRAYDIISDSFGPGYNYPLVAVVDGLKPVNPQDVPEPLALMGMGNRVHLQAVASSIEKKKSVSKVIVMLANSDGSAGVLQVIPSGGVYDESTTNLLLDLRNPDTQANWGMPNTAKVSITGTSAMQHDINQKISDALPIYFVIIVILAFILMLIAFRSVLIPVVATAGYILSAMAMFGALTAVFQWGWLGITNTPGPIVSFIPIITSGILFGLAMDYVFFLVSGIHEKYLETKDAKSAVLGSYSIGSRVIVAAAIIMVVVFAGFVSNSNNIIQTLGFSLSIGILVDAFLIRLTLLPALMHVFGKVAWWFPGRK